MTGCGILRPRTISHHLPIAPGDSATYPRGTRRPETRGDCAAGFEERNREVDRKPCCFVGCKHHLALDVTRAGSLKLNFPATTVDGIVENLFAMKATCTLDVAAPGVNPDGVGDGIALEEIGSLLNVTRERIRQMEEKFKRRLAGDPRIAAALGVHGDDYAETGQVPAMLPGEAARRLHRSSGHESEALLEVPEDLFELDDEDDGGEAGARAHDRASGIRAVAGEAGAEEPEQEARRTAS